MTLYTSITTRSGTRHTVTNVLIVVAGSILLALSAKIEVPFYPIPMSMQTFVVIGLGLALGPSLGWCTVLLYLAEGAAGLPVFAGTPEKGLGLAYMTGPTGGFLIGFLLAAALAGWLAERGWDRNQFTAILAALLAGAIIYVPGLLWLGSVIGFDRPVLQLGLIPFIPGDLAKALLAALVFSAAWKWLGTRGVR